MMSKVEPAAAHSLQPALTMFCQIVRCMSQNIVRNHHTDLMDINFGLEV